MSTPQIDSNLRWHQVGPLGCVSRIGATHHCMSCCQVPDDSGLSTTPVGCSVGKGFGTAKYDFVIGPLPKCI